LLLSVPLSSFSSNARKREKVLIQTVYTPTGESAARERCLWTSRNHDPSTAPTTTNLYPISRHSLQARITCDIPERIFGTGASFHLAQDPHLRADRQKHRKLVPSGSLDTLYTPMWRMLYQKMAIRNSSNFRQLTPNEEGRHHPWGGLLSIQTTHHLHRHSVPPHSNDFLPGYPLSSFRLYCLLKQSSRKGFTRC